MKFHIVRKNKTGPVVAIFEFKLHAELYAYNYGFYMEKETSTVEINNMKQEIIDGNMLFKGDSQ
jgi:hypothetical protein